MVNVLAFKPLCEQPERRQRKIMRRVALYGPLPCVNPYDMVMASYLDWWPEWFT